MYVVLLIAVFWATACLEMPGVTYRPNFSPLPCTWSATTWIPSVDPEFGNLVVSVTHRPYWSTFGPWLPGHWYQKSSTLTYRYPTAASPLLVIASAVASMLAAVGLRRMKLQLLHPSAGVRPTPLSCALAGRGDDPTATAIIGVAASTATRPRTSLLIDSPNLAAGLVRAVRVC